MHALTLLFLFCTLATLSALGSPLPNLSSPSLTRRGFSGFASPPPGALLVSKKAGKGQFGTIQAAVDEAKRLGAGDHVIFIHAGTYDESVLIKKGKNQKGKLTIFGETTSPGSYASNTVTITHGNSRKNKAKNDATATLRVHGDDVSVYNVKIINTFGQGAQAVALSAKGKRQGYYACEVSGYQDTLMVNDGTQYFSKCLIKGATDIIFGQRGHAFLHSCDISLPTITEGWLMAPGGGRDPNLKAKFVIDNSNVLAQPNQQPQSVYLARPWGQHSEATVQLTDLPSFINPLGWDIWHTGDERTKDAHFGEFQNRGPGANTDKRASYSHQIPQPVTKESILGDTAWIDQSFVAGE